MLTGSVCKEGEVFMKKQKIKGIGYLGAALVVLLSGLFTLSYGAVTLGIQWTRHNLGSTNVISGSQFHATNESEVCIFCHTPHNSVAGQNFLWNRQTDANSPNQNSFALYSSATLTSAALGAVISDVSKMCMSCHDGVTALNSMANPRTLVGLTPTIGDIYFNPEESGMPWGVNIGEGDTVIGNPGNNLRNDHPISFSYSDAQSQETNGGLKLIDNPRTEGLVFWGPNSDQIECVTCHDPHINSNPAYGGNPALAKFLRRSNASSNLCFACHNK